MAYEVYKEQRKITQWKDGCVYRTALVSIGWFPKDVIDANIPADTNLIYAIPNDDFACCNMTIRKV
jgi:hypothetical protein